MVSKRLLCSIAAGCSLAFVAGCSSSRDVQVSGQVSAPASGVQGEILVEFFDLTGEGDALERTSVHSIQLASPGAFDEKISVEGEKIAVRAINDTNGDGACSSGEAWAETEAEIGEEDRVEGLALQLALQPCPEE